MTIWYLKEDICRTMVECIKLCQATRTVSLDLNPVSLHVDFSPTI